MQRNSLEISLADAINKRHTIAANALIDLFLSYTDKPVPSLLSMDAEGCSFLYLSISAGAMKISDRLFELQKSDDSILFGKTQKQQTLFWEAANQRNGEFLEKLFAIVESKPKEHPCHQTWLQTADDGSSPLHQGVLNYSSKVVSLLLHHIMKEKNPRLLINQADFSGNTALHCAFRVPVPAIIDLLLTQGSDLNVPNNESKTPFSLFLLRSIEQQIHVINHISKNNQLLLINQYRNDVYKNPDNEKLRTDYFKCASIVSLKALIIAHHECNPHIPLRHLFTSWMPNQSNPKKLERVTNSLLNSTLLDQIPNYAKKLFVLENDAFGTKTDIKITDPIQLLNDDKNTINTFIDEIELFIIDLASRPKVISRPWLIALLFNWFAYIAIETCLIYLSVNFEYLYKSSSGWTDYDSCWVTALVLGIFGGFELAGFTTWFYVNCTKLIPSISKEEWRLMTEKLKENVIDKLHRLKENELPTEPHHIQALEKNLDALQSNQLATEVIPIFKAIKSSLIDIRKDMYLSSKPFTLFHPPTKPTIIEIPSDEEALLDSDGETVPFLVLD